MGVIAESLAVYAQPLLDATDGSLDQVQTAFSIAQLCWNLALMSDTEQEKMLAEMRPGLSLDDATFAEFREAVIAPMIARHHELFPNMPRQDSQPTTQSPRREKPFPGVARNAPCPCRSGRKYKRCCGK